MCSCISYRQSRVHATFVNSGFYGWRPCGYILAEHVLEMNLKFVSKVIAGTYTNLDSLARVGVVASGFQLARGGTNTACMCRPSHRVYLHHIHWSACESQTCMMTRRSWSTTCYVRSNMAWITDTRTSKRSGGQTRVVNNSMLAPVRSSRQ